MMDTVSIIMPVHNAEKYIDDAIQSVLIQSYSAWELLVIDDCSTDGSVSKIKRYQEMDSRIKLLTTEKSSGSPTVPRNEGVRAATGRFIAFLDSDDIWLPTKLEEQLKLFDNDRTAVVFSNYEKITEEGKRSGRIITAPYTTSYQRMLKGNVIGNLTGIYDTAKVGKIFFKHIHHEDYVLWLSILKRNFIARNTKTVTALYRIREHSVSSHKLSLLTWQWDIYVNIEKTGYMRAAYYYLNYAFRALLKSMI